MKGRKVQSRNTQPRVVWRVGSLCYVFGGEWV